MAFTEDTVFQDLTPVRSRSWDNNSYLAPAATEVKAGTIMEFASTTTQLLEVANTATASMGTAPIAGLLLQTVRDLDAGPIVGLRDLVTNDVNYSDPVTLIRGNSATKCQVGAQNATDLQAGWLINANINVGTLLYPSFTAGGGAPCNGGLTDDTTQVVIVGRALGQVTGTSGTLTFIFNNVDLA